MGVAQDRRAGRRPPRRPRGRAGHGRRQEDRLAQPARHRQRRHGQQPRPHPPHHGRVDGGADPPLQAGHRGLPGAGRPGLRPDRVASRRAGRPRRLRRRHASLPRALPRPVVHQPAGDERDERGRHGRRRHRRHRLDRPRHGRSRPMSEPDHRARPEDLGRAARDRGPLPRGALRPAPDAAPGAVGRGPDHARGHRGVRRDPRHQRRRGQRGRDLLHDVQAQAGRRLPRRRLHQHAVRGHGRRPDLRAAQGPPRRRQRRDHARTARSPSSTSSATRPATTPR